MILAGIYMLGVLGIVASGGGGSDDGDDEIIIQALYNFTIGGPLPDDPANNSNIDIDIQGAFTLMTEPNVVGTIICDQVTEVCELQTVENPSSVLIDDRSDTLFAGEIILTVSDFWVFASGSDQPSSGGLLIDRPGSSDITVEVTNCAGGSVLVTIDATSTCYSWDDFEDLAEDPGASDAALASLALEVIAFTVDQALDTLDIFPLIVDDVFADLGNPITESCDTWLGGWPVNPPLKPGFFTFSWSDDSGNGQVGPGDSFSQAFNECWFGDPNDDGILLDGSIDYVGYTQVIDQNGLLTRIGFETAAQGSGKIGGVALNSLVLTETTENNNIITTEDPITLTGRYLIVFE